MRKLKKYQYGDPIPGITAPRAGQCPEGQVWDAQQQKCVIDIKNPFGKDPWLAKGQPNPLTPKQPSVPIPYEIGQCPQGQKWDPQAMTCVPATVTPTVDNRPEYQMKSQYTFGDINYNYRALSNTIQGIAGFFREKHNRAGQNSYYRNQFNPLGYIPETGNTSQQNQFGMSYFEEGGETGDPTKPYHPLTNPDGYKPDLTGVFETKAPAQPYPYREGVVNNRPAVDLRDPRIINAEKRATSVGPAKEQTPAQKAENLNKKIAYANEHTPYAKVENGELKEVYSNYDISGKPTTPNQQRFEEGLDRIGTAAEIASYLYGAGEIYKGVKTLGAVAKNTITKVISKDPEALVKLASKDPDALTSFYKEPKTIKQYPNLTEQEINKIKASGEHGNKPLLDENNFIFNDNYKQQVEKHIYNYPDEDMHFFDMTRIGEGMTDPAGKSMAMDRTALDRLSAAQMAKNYTWSPYRDNVSPMHYLKRSGSFYDTKAGDDAIKRYVELEAKGTKNAISDLNSNLPYNGGFDRQEAIANLQKYLSKNDLPYLPKTQAEAITNRVSRLKEQGVPKNVADKLDNALQNHSGVPSNTAGFQPENLGVNKGDRTHVFTDAPLSEKQKALTAAHEVGHYYQNSPTEAREWLSHFDLPGTSEGNYLKGSPLYRGTGNRSGINVAKGDLLANGHANELRERAAQLKDYIQYKNGIKGDFKMTEAQLDDALTNYVKDTKLDNSMSTFINSIRNKKGLLKTMNKYPLALVPAVAGAAAINKYAEGGEYTGVSIVDYLKSRGMPSSKSARRAMAKEHNIEGYDLSASKNLEFLAKLRKENMPSTEQTATAPPPRVSLDPGNIPTYTPNTNPWMVGVPPNKRTAQPVQPAPSQKRFSLDPGNIPQAPAPNNSPWMLGAGSNNQPVQTPPPVRSIQPKDRSSGKSVTIPTGPNDIYNPLTNPTGYHPRLDKETLDALHAPAPQEQKNSSSYHRLQPDVNPDLNDHAGIGVAGVNAISDLAEEAITLGLNWNARRIAKNSPEDPTAISKLITPVKPIAEIPPIISGDTLRDPYHAAKPDVPKGSTNVFHIPQVVDLNRTKFKTRSRGQGWKDDTPTDTHGMLFSTMGGLGNDMINTSTAKLKDNSFYVGADPQGKIKIGYGRDFAGQNYQASEYPAHIVKGFAKDANGKYKQSAKAYNDEHGTAMLKTADGQEQTSLLILNKNPKNDESQLYGHLAGGKAIITSPDFSKKIFVSGSVKSIDEQLEKFKKDNNLDRVVYIIPDNGSQGRTYQTSNAKMTKKDWYALDHRDDSGGAGFYLDGKGFKRGGTVYADGGPVDFEADFENEMFAEPTVENTQPQQEEPEQEAQQQEEQPDWLREYLGSDIPRFNSGVTTDAEPIVQAFKNGIANVESGGDYYAQAKGSSAFGKYQFIKGTLEQIRKQFYPTISSKDFELSYKTNPEFQEKIMDTYSKYLLSTSNTPQEAAMKHFLGEAGFKRATSPSYNPGGNNMNVGAYVNKFNKGYKYEQGGEYSVSDDELQSLKDQGYDFEIID